MNRRLISIVCVLLLVVVAVRPAAGEDDEKAPPRSSLEEVMTRLTSGVDAEVAWGAYLAGRDGHDAAVPLLLRALRPQRPAPEGEWRLVHRAALDALIRLDAIVPEPLLAEYDGRLALHTLILRSRDLDAHGAALLEVFRRTVGKEKLGLYQLAVGNLLARGPTPGLAALLVDRYPLHLKVRVVTPTPGIFGGGHGRSILGGSGDGVAKVPEGFPPYAWYAIQPTDRGDAKMLAPGPRPVYVRRGERDTTGLYGGPVYRYEANELRAEWTAVLLGAPRQSIEAPSRKSIRVEWTTPEAYVERVIEARKRLVQPIWDRVRRLRAHGLLDAEEAGRVGPVLDIEIKDRREGEPPALPEIPPLARPADLEPEPEEADATR